MDSLSAPRGIIYDRNGKILVDNIEVDKLVFYDINGINKNDIAKKLAKIFIFDEPTEKEIIFWYKGNFNANDLLTENEKKLLINRKMTSEEKDEILKKRIINKTNNLTYEEKQIISIYNILSSGYNYSPKIVKDNITPEEISKVLELGIPNLKIETSFERHYPYNDTLKGILGSIGKITKERKNEYLKDGYKLTDLVGISYLEKYYDKYLQGAKAKYLLENNGNLKLISSEKKGNDLYLSIDIDLQLKIDEIIKNNLKQAKGYPNTSFLSDTYAIISSPKTGEILAISGKRILENGDFNDITINNISSSFTMGSVVKGATISVGFENKLFDPYEPVWDSCVKLNHITEKCSWKPLGYLNAITALKQSSNYYQFLLAIKLAGYDYYPNMDLNITEKEFNIYRNMLASYGLGIKTGVDLPNEKIGLIGEKISPDLLLNLAIGQYDTYTPIELLNYINTIASKGERRSPSLVNLIKNEEKVIYKNKYEIVNEVNISKSDFQIINEGFYEVMNGGTGFGHMNSNLKPAGKTGTSESFLDTDGDGNIDTSTITLTMAGYFPYDNPEYSLIVISPNVAQKITGEDYVYHISSKVSREITDFMFENMNLS